MRAMSERQLKNFARSERSLTESISTGMGFSYEEYLETYGSLTYTNVGVSMKPLLREGRDLFIVRKKGEERCGVGDVVLYHRPPESYVLHRIVEVRNDDYVILGDNCIVREYGIKDSDIIGVMTGFVRSGREHSVKEKSYRLYSYIWMHTADVRIARKRITALIKRRIKGLRHEG